MTVDTRATVNDGLRLLTHERIEPAVEAFRGAIKADPLDAPAHAFLAAAYFALGRADEADEAITTALELAPDGFWPNLKAGELRFRLGDLDAAESFFLTALRSVEPGTQESGAAASGLVLTRKARTRSIAHRAVLPAWLRRRGGGHGGDAAEGRQRDR
jgi:tetratricopeptide (TPR) repeat protein